MDETKMILLIEDNADDEALALRAFRRNHMRNPVVVARDGAEALDYLFDSENTRPAVILLDLKLPKVDGLEVLRRIRGDERTRLAPVVVLTSSREDHDVITSYRMGANSYVRKPVNFDEFLTAVHQLGTYWLGLNEAPPLPG
ncbi:MAG TPA: response regulator [Acidiferrobacteraceae bacterium]|nr:response regulator [Acidiferrobacteraceae bacterium]